VDATWRQDIGRNLSDDEIREWSRQVTAIQLQRDAEAKAKHAEVAMECQALFTEALAASSHPYLDKKQVVPHNAKIASDGRLMVPVYNIKGLIQSIQYIDDNGNKRFYPGGKIAGNFAVVGKASDIVYIAEGFATAATVNQVTSKCCIAALSAGNLVAVAKNIKELFPDSTIVVVGDNDVSGVGQKAAQDAANSIGCEFIIPPEEGDANDYVNAGGDLNYLLGKNDSWLVPADVFCDSNERVNWLISGYLQQNALHMIHGPSGCGKTFIVLDMVLHLASGMTMWNNRKVDPCPVVYLAGEGHRGLKGRILAWKHRYGVADLAMWVSKSGCDLDVAAELAKTINGIASLPTKPGIVVIDTLHRFMSGDENHSQDVKKILDACAKIQATFDCSLVLIHHTGHATVKRGRGSSAWRGALDIEFGVEMADDGPTKLTKLIQIKNKDSERVPDFLFTLSREIVPDCLDEYGEQVYSAVVEPVDKSQATSSPVESKHTGHLKTMHRAWVGGGMKVSNGLPYITRQDLKTTLVADGNSEQTATAYLKPSTKSGTIYPLINGGEIIVHQDGWVIVNKVFASVLIMEKNRK
jgi:hypothetical protein